MTDKFLGQRRSVWLKDAKSVLQWLLLSCPVNDAAIVAVWVLVVSLLAASVRAQSAPAFQMLNPSPSFQTQPSPDGQSADALAVPSPTTAPPEYRVGAGDVLGITVFNMPELNRVAVVGSKGTLVFSYLPRPLDVDGKTTQEIGEAIAVELKQLQVLIDPQVSVAVVRVESKPVVVGGNVRNPQVLQEVRPLTLQEALMLAGGPQSEAGNSVLVTRSDGSGGMVAYDIDLAKVLSGTDPKSNIPVQPGDTIQVLPDQKVFVAGDVKNPGAFPMGRGQKLTVSKLMALTGGWKQDAKPTRAVIVREGPNGQRRTIPLNLPKIMARKQSDVALQANDLLYVPNSTEKEVGLAAIKGIGGAAMWGLGYYIIRP
ncbi:MAG TPA: polysaccharide biosynthesis/export family protein [Terriglobia bacterium]|nr:polysaccharide biosynthesis/export family protein [Terriglobia bacterium]